MRRMIRTAAAAATLLVAASAPGAAQSDKLAADLVKTVEGLETKVMGLAKALPDAAYAWRPMAGVRSGGEVFQHIAADNYIMPVYLGVSAPAATGITSDYNTAMKYETRKITREEIIADLTRSFAHLKQAMLATDPAKLTDPITMFGQTFSRQRVLILTTTHLHEHLGQLIAYARSNSVKPPWS
jgi:uncharacterized damage-inducible protein DinB